MKNLLCRIFAVSIAVATLLSASPPVKAPVEPARCLHALSLGMEAVNKFQCSVSMADEVYVCPTKAQIPGLLATAAKSRTTMRVKEAFDCDDAAREYRALSAKWSVGQWPTLEAAVAVGTCFANVSGKVDGLCDYGTGGLHALIVLRRADGQWMFIEPGTDRAANVEEALYEGTIEVLGVDL